MARTAALHVAGSPGLMYNPLFVYGGVGLGKTHLVHAVGNALLADKPDARILYLHAEQFITDVVKNYQRKTFDELKAQVPLARPAADRRRPVLRRQGAHAGGVLQRLRGAARQARAHHHDQRHLSQGPGRHRRAPDLALRRRAHGRDRAARARDAGRHPDEEGRPGSDADARGRRLLRRQERARQRARARRARCARSSPTRASTRRKSTSSWHARR